MVVSSAFQFPGDVGLVAGLAIFKFVGDIKILIVPAIIANVISADFYDLPNLAFVFACHRVLELNSSFIILHSSFIIYW